MRPVLSTSCCSFGAAGIVLSLLLLAAPGGARAPGSNRPPAPAPLVETTISRAEWDAYRRRFIAPSGRVVDREQRGVSHSEGQGYGLLLAVYADDRATFEQILSFTLHRLLRERGDGLASWLYDPAGRPYILDANNASDGDILIAYALLTAAIKWNVAQYLALAQWTVAAIGTTLLDRRGDIIRLRPAARGFEAGEHVGGPVLNLSYYVYGAFLLFERVDARFPWHAAWQSGLRLTEGALRGGARLPPDWVTVRSGRDPRPAAGFPRRAGYEVVRIPLYMALGGRVPPRHFAPFDAAWNLTGTGRPGVYDFAADRTIAAMDDPGYRTVAALTACAARGVPLPEALQRFVPQTYYASSLHLLALAAARGHYPHCARRPPEPADTHARTQARPATQAADGPPPPLARRLVATPDGETRLRAPTAP